MTALRKWGPWAALIITAVVVLSIGLHSSSTPSLDARVQSIASQVRCPVCAGETVAQSQTAPSVEIRNQIRSELVAGRSRSQILAGLVQAYGPGILEKPQTSGIDLVVWVVPVVAVVAAAGGLVLVLRRWKVRSAVPPAAAVADGVGPDPVGPGAAGPAVVGPPVAAASPESARPAPALAGSARRRLPGVGRLARGGAEPSRPVWRPRTRWAVGGLGAVIVASGASWAAVSALHKSLPGQSITGQALPAERIAADLQAADTYASKNDVVNAVKEYEKVLKAQPEQVQALTGLGWILAQTGQPSLLKQGLTQLASAERVDPTYAPAHLYRGIALLGEGDYTGSVPELQWYLDHNPDPQLTAQVKKALAQAEAGRAATPSGSGSVGSGSTGAGSSGASGSSGSGSSGSSSSGASG